MVKKTGLLKLLLEAYKEWFRDRAKGTAPALAYYELLSAGPLIGFVLFFTYKILGANEVQEEIIPLLKSTFTPQMTKAVIFLLHDDKKLNGGEIYTLSILSALLLIWAAREYFGQVKITIETTWNLRREKFGFRELIKIAIKEVKIAAVSISIILLFIFIRSLLPHPNIGKEGIDPDGNHYILKMAQWITEFLLLCSLRIFYFTYIPPVKVNWRNAVPGAILGALLFIIGKEIMEAHFRERQDADIAESFLMVLLWLYYANLTFIYSAQFTKLYIASRQNIDLKSLKFDEQ